MTINDLKTSISEMNRQEALRLVLERRESRMTRKTRKQKRKDVDPLSLKEVESVLNDEQLLELYERLKEKQK